MYFYTLLILSKKHQIIMAFEVTGKLHEKLAAQQISDRFKKREFVLEIEDGAYSQHIKFQLTQDRCDLIEPHQIGQDVKVSFNLRGRPYQNKQGETVYFTNLEAWRIEGGSVGAKQNTPAVANDPFPTITDIPPATTGANDDLPF
jgi:spore germination protein YaaH